MIKLLLSRKADIARKDKFGRNCLDWAIENNQRYLLTISILILCVYFIYIFNEYKKTVTVFLKFLPSTEFEQREKYKRVKCFCLVGWWKAHLIDVYSFCECRFEEFSLICTKLVYFFSYKFLRAY